MAKQKGIMWIRIEPQWWIKVVEGDWNEDVHIRDPSDAGLVPARLQTETSQTCSRTGQTGSRTARPDRGWFSAGLRGDPDSARRRHDVRTDSGFRFWRFSLSLNSWCVSESTGRRGGQQPPTLESILILCFRHCTIELRPSRGLSASYYMVVNLYCLFEPLHKSHRTMGHFGNIWIWIYWSFRFNWNVK